MKKVKWTAIAGMAFVMLVPATAERHGNAQDPKRIEKHVQRLARKLDLTAEQTNLVRVVLLQKQKRMGEVRKEMELIREQAVDEIKSLLTDEQKEKFKKIEMKMRKGREKE